MGKHSKPTSGKHRATASTGSTVARAVAAGTLAALAFSVATPATAEAAEFDRDAIIACESGGDPRAQNPDSTASGLYQMINSTWMSVRGSSTATRAKDATVAHQHAAALRLFNREGYRPWNASRSCWSNKIRSASATASASASLDTSLRSSSRGKSSTYVVKRGDTLSTIAVKLSGSADWSKLYSVNAKLIGNDPHRILPGMELTVR